MGVVCSDVAAMMASVLNDFVDATFEKRARLDALGLCLSSCLDFSFLLVFTSILLFYLSLLCFFIYFNFDIFLNYLM